MRVESRTEEVHSKSGLQETESSKTRENDKIYWSKIALSGSEYLASRAQMKTKGNGRGLCSCPRC